MSRLTVKISVPFLLLFLVKSVIISSCPFIRSPPLQLASGYCDVPISIPPLPCWLFYATGGGRREKRKTNWKTIFSFTIFVCFINSCFPSHLKIMPNFLLPNKRMGRTCRFLIIV
uniref:Secreted protein n=1 Tax=Opuntia streptacantha TaxID=393608 RepID=A0A7C8Z8P6_OPUST